MSIFGVSYFYAIVQGKVPRNEYGNVELFQPSMLPPGGAHVKSKTPALNLPWIKGCYFNCSSGHTESCSETGNRLCSSNDGLGLPWRVLPSNVSLTLS